MRGPAELLRRPLNLALAPGNDYLADGRRAWWQTGEFGCQGCAVATLLGCDLGEVPDAPPREHSKVEELNTLGALNVWAHGRGLRVTWRELEPALLEREWIGISRDPRPGFSHTVVMSGRHLIFDPALAVPVPDGYAVAPVTELHYALTFDQIGAP